MHPTESEALHNHALQALEAADMALAHAPDLAIDEPCRADQLNVDSLQQMLGGTTPGAVLKDAELADAHDGMTSRNKWTLRWNAVGRDAGLPASVFVKATPDGPYLRETLSMLHMAELEVNFYRHVQPELPDLAPRAYYARSYPGGRFMLLMEDLEARGLRPYWSVDDCPIAHATAVLTALAQLHAQFWESPRFAGDLAWVRPRTQRFGFEWHQKSFHAARQKFLESNGGDMPADIAELLRLWDANDRAVYAYWDTLPATLMHGDSHLGNTFSSPEGRAGLSDWQVIHRGHGLRELAYFLLGALDDTARRQHERPLVHHYLDQLEQRGVKLDREQAWQNYALFALDRFDAHIKTYVRGGYGHAASSLERGRLSTIGALQDHGVADLLRRVVRDGKL